MKKNLLFLIACKFCCKIDWRVYMTLRLSQETLIVKMMPGERILVCDR